VFTDSSESDYNFHFAQKIDDLKRSAFFVGGFQNRPNLSANATWSTNGTVLTDTQWMYEDPLFVHVNRNNTIFAYTDDRKVVLWSNLSLDPTSNFSIINSYSSGVYITDTDEIIVVHRCPIQGLQRWTKQGVRQSTWTFYLPFSCTRLFIDVHGNLYCSEEKSHRVIRTTPNVPNSAFVVVAGTGCSGSASNMLRDPDGVTVATNMDLYVADCKNDRIQLFRSGQLNGTTVAGNGASGTFGLSNPRDVILDANEYLFIVDSGNNRIIRSDPFGFRCIIGCSRFIGLKNPRSISFDNIGNIFIANDRNQSIMKFLLIENRNGKC
jgi:hypothetical protein